MSAGIQIINTNNSVIIDENYYNFTLRSKGTAAIGSPPPQSSTGWGSTGMVVLTVDAEAPMLAIYASMYTALKSSVRNGSTWTFTIYTDGNSGTIDWFLFDKANYASDEGCGLQVFNADGSKVYDSSKGAASIRDSVYHAQLGPYGADFYSRNDYDGGRKYAIVHSLPAIGWVPVGHVQLFTYIQRVYAAARSGGTGYVEFGRMIAFQGMMVDQNEDVIRAGPYISSDYNCLVLDVTNL